MISFRQKRKLLALFGAGVILFAQFAMAAHACMVMEPAQALSITPAMDGENPPCHEADPGEPNACLTHCQVGLQQSFDGQPAPSIVLMPVFAFSIGRYDFLSLSTSTRAYSQAILARATAPPAMVRNCCLRI